MSNTDDRRLIDVFPQYDELGAMVRAEISPLDDATLDWTSDEFGWAGWSIRQQASHLASVLYRWLLIRWRDQLFPAGIPVDAQTLSMLSSEQHDRRLNDDHFWSTADILDAMTGALNIARSVMRRVPVQDARSMTVTRTPTAQWPLMYRAHPDGVTLDIEGGGTMTLEATFRHIYFEFLTHLHNIQRIKKARGESNLISLPDEGYHTVEGWD